MTVKTTACVACQIGKQAALNNRAIAYLSCVDNHLSG